MRKLILPLVACCLAACSTLPSGADPEPLADGQDYALAGAYALLAVPALPIQAVAVDSSAPGYSKAAITDNNLTTHWDNGGYRNASAWASVDLGAAYALGSIVIKLPPTPGQTTYDVQVSSNGTAWTTVLAAQTNTTWNPVTKLLPATTTGRHVRILWHNDPANPQPHFSLYELRVQGAEAGGPVPTPTPLPTPTPVPTPAPTATPRPLPTTLGPFALVNDSAAVVQYRPGKGRLRIDVGCETAGSDARLEALGPEACALVSRWHLTSSCDVRLAGTDTCVIPTGPYGVPLELVPGEDGVLTGQDAAGNIMELIWPNLSPGEVPGPPIVRVQLAQWTPAVTGGTPVDVDFTVQATDDLGNVLRWTGQGRNLPVPF